MKFNFLKSTCSLLSVLGMALMSVSCQKEADCAESGPSIPVQEAVFSIEEADPEIVETQSVLTDASIETKRTGVTIGVYENGTLVDKSYGTSFSGLTFTLEQEKTYKIYALVNMGDLQSQLPANEASLSSLVYTIPAYTGSSSSVNSLGIPMAGFLEYESGVSTVTVIPVKRLLAKVTAVLSCDWNGAKIKSAKVYNMNKRLKPFGTSAATGSSDMLSFQEVQMADGVGSNSLTGTFYVPENMQGTVSGITSAYNKAGDKNSTVSANISKLTYLEVSVESEGKYDGDVTYRSYLGNNSTTNFDIQRNYRYFWTIHYRSDTVDDYNDDWKHDYDGLEVVDYSLSLSPNPNTIAAGANFTYTTTLSRNVIKPSASTTSSVLGNSDATWSSSNTAVATVSSTGVVTGVAAGTANITARYTPAGSDLSERTATASVTVQTVAHELELSALGTVSGLKHNETTTLKATYYTVTNGVRDAGTDVTSSAVWTHTGGTKYAVASGVVSANATAGAPSVQGTTTITATYSGVGSMNSVDVAFVDITTGTTTISPASASGTYLSPAVFTATYVGTVNGFTTENTNVTNAAVWNVTGTKYSVSNGSVTADASAGDHSVAGTVTVTAVYGGSTSNSATATFTDVVENSLTISPASGAVQAGGANVNLTARYITNRNGYEVANNDVTTSASWSSNNSGVSVSAGVVTASLSATGVAIITATYSGKTATTTLTVSDAVITHYLVVSPASASAKVGETISLSAVYHTVTNGTDDGGVDVTSSANWSKSSGASSIVVNNSGADKGKVTATAGGTATIAASYAGESSLSSVTFTDVLTYELEVTGASSANVGETIALTATFYTLTNGSRDAGTDVTTNTGTTWSPVTGTISVSNSGADKGKVTATAGGTATIFANYNNGKSYNASKNVTFNNVDVEKYRLVLSPASATINWNASTTFTVKRYTDIYRNGALYTSGTTATDMAASNFNWSTGNNSIATVSSGVVTGTGTGTTSVTATLKTSVTDYAKYNNTSTSGNVTVNEVKTYRLTLAADAASKPYNGTINLTAKYYTTTNGVEDSGVNVIPSALTKTSGGSNITLTAGNPSTAKLTNPALSVISNNKATITATYSGSTSNAVNIEFTNVTSYAYTRLVVSGDSNVNVGSATGNYTATLHTQTYVNGAASGSAATTDVSSSASFTSSNTGVATVSGRKATGVTAGTTYIAATYSGTYGSIASTGSDRATLTVGNVEEDRYRLVMTPATATINWNETKTYVINRYTDHYVNGVKTVTGTTAYTMSNSDFNWTSSSTATATVNSTGIATGVYAGTATITATLKSSVTGYSKYTNTTLTSSLTVQNVIEYSLILTKADGNAIPSGLQLAVGYTRSLKAWYRTYVNGVQTEQTEVTTSATWTASPSTKATVSGGEVTGVSNGVVTITASSTPSSKPNRTASASIEIVGGGSEGWDDDWDDGGEVILD